MTSATSGHTDLAPTGKPYRVPSLARRLALGTVLLFPFVILYIVLPTLALGQFSRIGLTSPIPTFLIVAGGAALSILGAARYIVKPTRAFGPVWVTGSLVALGYLLLLLPYASFSVAPGNNATLTLDYRMLLILVMAIPAISLVAGLVTSWEDARHPKERLPYDFPA